MNRWQKTKCGKDENFLHLGCHLFLGLNTELASWLSVCGAACGRAEMCRGVALLRLGAASFASLLLQEEARTKGPVPWLGTHRERVS